MFAQAQSKLEPEAVFEARHVTKVYRMGEVEVQALRSVDVDLYEGELMVLLGASGGEQQRVAIARAVAKRPEVLLCDEPTGALDYRTGKLVLEVIEKVNRELGTTTAVITHNAAIADMADRVIRMQSGRIVDVHRDERKCSPAELEW
jgi:ABC-type lipoprotein export system ATPase subunit